MGGSGGSDDRLAGAGGEAGATVLSARSCWIIAVMTGSSNFAMRVISGSFDGLSISLVTPSVVVTRRMKWMSGL